MPELLKNKYNEETIRELARRIQAVYHPFQEEDFVRSVMDGTWESL